MSTTAVILNQPSPGRNQIVPPPLAETESALHQYAAYEHEKHVLPVCRCNNETQVERKWLFFFFLPIFYSQVWFHRPPAWASPGLPFYNTEFCLDIFSVSSSLFLFFMQSVSHPGYLLHQLPIIDSDFLIFTHPQPFFSSTSLSLHLNIQKEPSNAWKLRDSESFHLRSLTWFTVSLVTSQYVLSTPFFFLP